MTTEADNQIYFDGFGRLPAAVLELIERAEVIRNLPSTRSDLGEEIEWGVALVREGDPPGVRLLEHAVEAVVSFRHIVYAEGDLFLSLYVRGMLDNAHWALESSSTSSDVAERIREAQRLIELGNEAGVAALEAAISQAR